MIPDRYRPILWNTDDSECVRIRSILWAACSRRQARYRHSLRCISPSSRTLDPGYLHSHVYFALKELSVRLILSVSRPPTSFPRPYPRWWNLSCYCAVKAKWNYRIFSPNFARPDARKGEKELKPKLVRRCRRLRYVFLSPLPSPEMQSRIRLSWIPPSPSLREIVLNANTVHVAYEV